MRRHRRAVRRRGLPHQDARAAFALADRRLGPVGLADGWRADGWLRVLSQAWPADRLNYDYFALMLDSEITSLELRAYHLSISRAGGFHTFFPDLYQLMSFENTGGYENYLARLEKMQKYFEESIDLMRLGLRTGFIPARVTLEGVDKSTRTQIGEDPNQSALFEPFKKFPASISGVEQERLIEAAHAAITGSVVPA